VANASVCDLPHGWILGAVVIDGGSGSGYNPNLSFLRAQLVGVQRTISQQMNRTSQVAYCLHARSPGSRFLNLVVFGLFAILVVGLNSPPVRAHLAAIRCEADPDAAYCSKDREIDLQFQCNADVSENSIKNDPNVIALARALSGPDLKEAAFEISVYTSGHSNTEEDRSLSERCANLVRRVLIDQFGLQPAALRAAGHGATNLKNPNDAAALENQRLNIRVLSDRPRER
jgi:outer membrane protein OmpA-like peptidoglycan-associated protein